MSRARNIKPGFFKNDQLAECEPLARLLFAGLWCEADREGRLEDRPKRLKADCLPYDDCDIDALLDQLAERGFIVRYSVGNARYIAIPEFGKHQNPHRKETASSIPAPDRDSPRTDPAPEIPERATLIPDSPSLIPDSCKNEASGDTPPPAAVADRTGQFEGHDDPQPGINPVAPFAVAMNRLGFRCTSLTPDLVAYQRDGGTVDHLTECAQLPDCTGKPAAYAIRIARRELAERAPAINGASHEPTRERSGRRLSAVEQVEHAIAQRREREAAAGRTFDA
jgi:hypothetical protein